MNRMKSPDWIKMSWCLSVTYYGLLVLIFTPISECITLPPVHWNSSNPMFKTSNNDHIIEVNAYDRIDFICPYHPSETASDSEYYVIYFVSKREYDDCNMYSELGSSAVPIVNCSNPKNQKYFSLLFEPYTSIPNVPEYQKGGTYYYITTSTGHKEGINNGHQGACLYRNMKLTIKVCCDSTTPPTIPPLAPSTNGSSPSLSPPGPQAGQVTNQQPSGEATSSTTTTSTTSTARPPYPRPSSAPPVSVTPVSSPPAHGGNGRPSTRHPGFKYTDKVPDKKKPNNKPDENETYPKHEELVNSAASSTTTTAATRQYTSLLFSTLAASLLALYHTYSYASRTL